MKNKQLMGFTCPVCTEYHQYWVRFLWHLFDHCASQETWLRCDICDQRRLFNKKNDYIRKISHGCVRQNRDFKTEFVAWDLNICMEYLNKEVGADQESVHENFREYNARNMARKPTKPEKVRAGNRKIRADKGCIRSELPTYKLFCEKEEKRKEREKKSSSTSHKEESRTSSVKTKVPASTTPNPAFQRDRVLKTRDRKDTDAASSGETTEDYTISITDSDEDWRISPGIKIEEPETVKRTPIKRKNKEEESGKSKRKREETITKEKECSSHEKKKNSKTDDSVEKKSLLKNLKRTQKARRKRGSRWKNKY